MWAACTDELGLFFIPAFLSGPGYLSNPIDWQWADGYCGWWWDHCHWGLYSRRHPAMAGESVLPRPFPTLGLGAKPHVCYGSSGSLPARVCMCVPASGRALLGGLSFQCSLWVPLVSEFGLEAARPLRCAVSGAVVVSPTPVLPTRRVMLARWCPGVFCLLVCSYTLQPEWESGEKTIKSSFQIYWVSVFSHFKCLRFFFNVISHGIFTCCHR